MVSLPENLAGTAREILSAPAEILSPKAKFSPQSGNSLSPRFRGLISLPKYLRSFAAR